MKYIENRDLAELSLILSNRNMGVYTINGRIEAFDFLVRAGTTDFDDDPNVIPMKRSIIEDNFGTGVLTRNRSNSVDYSAFRRPVRRRASSLGDLSEPTNQKLFMNLISALTDSFPDYDFQKTKLNQFLSLEVAFVIRRVNSYFTELNDSNSLFLNKLWQTIDLIINLRCCEVFSYFTGVDDDLFDSGSLWSFNYFFFHKDTMKICYLSCVATSNLRIASRSNSFNYGEEDDEDEFEDCSDVLEESSSPVRKKRSTSKLAEEVIGMETAEANFDEGVRELYENDDENNEDDNDAD